MFIERTGISDPRAMVKIAKEGAARRGDGTTYDQILLEGHLVSMELGCHLTKVATERLGMLLALIFLARYDGNTR